MRVRRGTNLCLIDQHDACGRRTWIVREGIAVSLSEAPGLAGKQNEIDVAESPRKQRFSDGRHQ
jgi:hypothetical protein